MTEKAFHIEQYKSLFKGRTDIFAKRWEKDGRSGYMPAYKVDWTDYNKHKAQGGTFKDYKNKEYLPFTDQVIEAHLLGKETHGIYPLLEDNTSFFIAVDFDKQNWQETILKLHHICVNTIFHPILNVPGRAMVAIYGYFLNRRFRQNKAEK
jgi:hypothetical protein